MQAVATNSVFIMEWKRPVPLEEYFLPASGGARRTLLLDFKIAVPADSLADLCMPPHACN